MLSKIKKLSNIIEERKLSIEIEVEGGVNEEAALLCIEAGATVLVAGSAIYNKEDRQNAIKILKQQKIHS